MCGLLFVLVTAAAAVVTGVGQTQLVNLAGTAALSSAMTSTPLGLVMAILVYGWNRLKGRSAKGLVLGFAAGITTTVVSMFTLGEVADDNFLGMLSALGYGFVGGSSVGIVGNLATTLNEDGKTLTLKPAMSAGLSGLLIFFLNSFTTSEAGFNLNFSQENLLAALTGVLSYYVGAQLGLRRPLDWLLSKVQLNWQLRNVPVDEDMRAFTRGTNIITDFAPKLEAILAPTAANQQPLALKLPHVTRYAIPQLRRHVGAWLEDWDSGLDNVNQIWRYTNQQPSVSMSVQQVLADSKPEQQVEKVAKFADKFNDNLWPMLVYATPANVVDRGNNRRVSSAEARAVAQNRLFQRERIRRALSQQTVTTPRDLPLETPAQQAIAGFRHLQDTFIQESIDAFQKLPPDTLGKELQGIAQSIQKLLHTHNLVNSPTVELPERPKETKRKATWDALEQFKQVVRYAWLYHHCKDEERGNAVKDVARHKLDEIEKDIAKVPQAERAMIAKLIKLWRKEFDQWVATRRKPATLKPANPFIFLEPLRERKPFVGREAALKTLKQTSMRGSRQPVLLYGLPKIGKSSLIFKATFDYHEDICFTVFNLPRDKPILAAKDVLWAMCQSLQRRTNHPAPTEQRFQLDPFAATEGMIRDVCRQYHKGTQTIIIGNVDLLFTASAEPVLQRLNFTSQSSIADRLLDFWWNLAQMIGNLNFIFVSHTDSLPDNPFTRSLKKIQLENLTAKEVLKLLMTPTPEFSPLFAPEAVDYIFTLTDGQPFLVQLIAFCVVDRFNQSLDKDDKLEPVFLIKDVESILTTDTFIQFSQPYFQHRP